MMGYALPISVEMSDMSCGQCGIHFSVPERWRAEKQKTGDGWYCPNGHSRVYKESDLDKARKELAAEQERHKRTLARANQAEINEREAAGKISRLTKRVGNGVCPCCNRTFKQLASHMKCKHPNYAGPGER